MTDKIKSLLEGRYTDPQTGETLGVANRTVVIERDLRGSEADLIRGLGFGRSLAVVSDENTYAALGRRVEQALSSIASISSIVLPAGTHPDKNTAISLIAATDKADALIAVGSGTINDLCKYASASQKKPYAVFATAPSMNGYTSINAAITVDGLKKTLAAHGATGVFVDVGVFVAAPMRLILSGYGDSICRSTAQADWYMAHKVYGTPYREAPYDLLYDEEDILFSDPQAIAKRDPTAIECLARVLTLSGFGMTICGGSTPASQGEHMISHFMDMVPPLGWAGAYHGEQVAVTTVTSATVQEFILNSAPPVLTESKTTQATINSVFGDDLGKLCWEEYRQKRLYGEIVERTNERLKIVWPELQRHHAHRGWSGKRVRDALIQAGAPTKPQDLGLSPDYYRTAVTYARTIRNRFSFLDIACDLEGVEIADLAVT